MKRTVPMTQEQFTEHVKDGLYAQCSHETGYLVPVPDYEMTVIPHVDNLELTYFTYLTYFNHYYYLFEGKCEYVMTIEKDGNNYHLGMMAYYNYLDNALMMTREMGNKFIYSFNAKENITLKD